MITSKIMKNPLLVLALFAMAATAAQAQESQAERDAAAAAMQAKAAADTTGKLWTKGGTIQLNMSQVSLTNWSAGGFSSVSGVGLFNAFANRKNGRHAWDNSVALAYGLLSQEKQDPVKTDDRIELNTKYGYELGKAWYLAALAQFRTQFAEGKDAEGGRISDFMAPGYLVLGIGMDYKPNDRFSAFLSPATAKITFVGDQPLADAGAFGVDPATYDTAGAKLTNGKNSLFEFGGFVKLTYTQDLAKNINFLTRADFFSNYLKNPQNIVVNWETLFTFKVNDWFAATLGTMLIYDDKTQIMKKWDDTELTYAGKGTQFKETIGLGITLKF